MIFLWNVGRYCLSGYIYLHFYLLLYFWDIFTSYINDMANPHFKKLSSYFYSGAPNLFLPWNAFIKYEIIISSLNILNRWNILFLLNNTVIFETNWMFQSYIPTHTLKIEVKIVYPIFITDLLYICIIYLIKVYNYV